MKPKKRKNRLQKQLREVGMNVMATLTSAAILTALETLWEGIRMLL